MEELIRNYDESGLLTMIVQEFIQWEQFVRCMCLGQEEILVDARTTPRNGSYIPDDDYLAPALKERVIRDCRTHRAGAGLRHEHGRVRRPGRRCPTPSTS